MQHWAVMESIGVATVGKIGATLAGIGLCIFIEDLFPRGDRLTFKDRIPGTMLSLVQASLWFLVLTPLQELYGWLGVGSLVVVPLADWTEPMGIIGTAIGVLVLLLVADFFHYWWHRADHLWFWPIHAAHHTPQKLQAASNYGHPAQAFTGFLFMGIPLSLIQIEGPVMPALVITILGLAEFLIHSPTSFHLGPLRRVLVDNRFHRIHHSVEPRHLNKNFGIVFTIWDQLFRTAYFPEKDEWPEVGVRELEEPRGVSELLWLPLKVMGDGMASRPTLRTPERI